MNELTTRLQEIMVPKAVLIAYAYDSNTYRTNDKYHLELRPISPDGRMGAAIPVSHEFIGALADNYSADICRIPYGRIPPNLLECNSRKGHEKYVWYNPPGRHRMFFTGGLNIADGEFNLPGVVYKVEKERMDIYAFKGDSPEERTELYRAPFSTSHKARSAWAAPRWSFRRTRPMPIGWHIGKSVSGQASFPIWEGKSTQPGATWSSSPRMPATLPSTKRSCNR